MRKLNDNLENWFQFWNLSVFFFSLNVSSDFPLPGGRSDGLSINLLSRHFLCLARENLTLRWTTCGGRVVWLPPYNTCLTRKRSTVCFFFRFSAMTVRRLCHSNRRCLSFSTRSISFFSFFPNNKTNYAFSELSLLGLGGSPVSGCLPTFCFFPRL